MKTRFVSACAATGIALMAFGATTAAAESTERPYAAIGIDDDIIKSGQEVRVSASCQDPKFTSSKIHSPVLTAPDLVRAQGAPADSVLFSMGKIAANTKPGTYPISFTCVDREITGEFTVDADKNPAPTTAQVPVKPQGAANTGSLDQPAAAPASSDGSGAPLIGVGATALLAAGAGVWAHRRRRHA
jgi:hypothetical protein